MSTFELALTITASSVAYLVIAGITWAVVPPKWRDEDNSSNYNGEPAVFAAVFWPVILPSLFGAWLVRRMMRVSLPRAAAKERQR